MDYGIDSYSLFTLFDSMKDFCAIDFETANFERTSICSVGIVIVKDGNIIQRIHRLVRPTPNYYIARFSDEIHGIYFDDTVNEPTFDVIWQEIAPLIYNLPLVAHNKSFDENVLKHTLKHYGLTYPEFEFYCTLAAARKKIPKSMIGNHRLPTVCAYLGIDFANHHDALADAEGCARIALELL